MSHTEAIRVIKKQLEEHIHNTMMLETQITSLLQHKEELNDLVRSLEESIKVLGQQNESISTSN